MGNGSAADRSLPKTTSPPFSCAVEASCSISQGTGGHILPLLWNPGCSRSAWTWIASWKQHLRYFKLGLTRTGSFCFSPFLYLTAIEGAQTHAEPSLEGSQSPLAAKASLFSRHPLGKSLAKRQSQAAPPLGGAGNLSPGMGLWQFSAEIPSVPGCLAVGCPPSGHSTADSVGQGSQRPLMEKDIFSSKADFTVSQTITLASASDLQSCSAQPRGLGAAAAAHTVNPINTEKTTPKLHSVNSQ